jgi:hypothetical protein
VWFALFFFSVFSRHIISNSIVLFPSYVARFADDSASYPSFSGCLKSKNCYTEQRMLRHRTTQLSTIHSVSFVTNRSPEIIYTLHSNLCLPYAHFPRAFAPKFYVIFSPRILVTCPHFAVLSIQDDLYRLNSELHPYAVIWIARVSHPS